MVSSAREKDGAGFFSPMESSAGESGESTAPLETRCCGKMYLRSSQGIRGGERKRGRGEWATKCVTSFTLSACRQSLQPCGLQPQEERCVGTEVC